MATIKAYTDLQQSRKLAEILPIESADACWTNHSFNYFLSSWRVESTPPQEYKALLDRYIVKGYLIEPCWSLSALLYILAEQGFTIKSLERNNKYQCNIDIPIRHCKIWFSSLLDAAFEMICWLKENNKL